MGSRKDRKLRNYFLRNDLQLRMISASLVYMCIVTAVMLTVLFFPLVHQMMTAAEIEVQYAAAQTFLTLSHRLVPAVGVMVLLIFVHQVVLSHRICGPLVNFSHTFRRLGRGDLTRKVVLRHGDYLKKECEKINEMIDGMSALIFRVRRDNDRLVSMLAENVSRIEDRDSQARMEEVLAEAKRQADALRQDLSHFKLPDESRAS